MPRDRIKNMNTATQDSSNTKQNKDPQGRARAPFDLATSCVSVFPGSIGIAFLKDPNILIIQERVLSHITQVSLGCALYKLWASLIFQNVF